MKQFFLLLISFYQRTTPIRHQFYTSIGIAPHACIHHPTCSQYATQALRNYGTITGIFLITKRLLSCHRFSSH